jgi:hypothetical protein
VTVPRGDGDGPAASVSMAENWESGRLVANPGDGTLVVIGVSNRLLRRDDEILAARRFAAWQVAMFHGVRGTVDFFLATDGGVLGFASDARVSLELGADFERFVDQLNFDPERDVLRFDGGTAVRFRYDATVNPVRVPRSTDSDGRPSWVNGHRLPEVPGYVVAVGVAQNQLRMSDTVMRSLEMLAANMITSSYTRVENEVTETSLGVSVFIRSRSEGALNNFRVLEMWMDPRNGYVYTLGMASTGN